MWTTFVPFGRQLLQPNFESRFFRSSPELIITCGTKYPLYFSARNHLRLDQGRKLSVLPPEVKLNGSFDKHVSVSIIVDLCVLISHTSNNYRGGRWFVCTNLVMKGFRLRLADKGSTLMACSICKLFAPIKCVSMSILFFSIVFYLFFYIIYLFISQDVSECLVAHSVAALLNKKIWPRRSDFASSPKWLGRSGRTESSSPDPEIPRSSRWITRP